jgi:hypothetical protein
MSAFGSARVEKEAEGASGSLIKTADRIRRDRRKRSFFFALVFAGMSAIGP